MYALRLSILWIFIVGSIVQCSASSIYNFGRANVIVGGDPSNPCSATRECFNCTHSKLCLPVKNKFQQVAVIDCSSDPSRPYCDSDTGLCTSVAPNGCSSSEFICPLIDGVYPDPRSCTRYHICVNGYRTTNICPPNNVYDASIKDCKLIRYSIDCVTISCTGKEGKFFTYPKDDRIYGACVDGKSYIIGRCEDYEKFDVNSGQCNRVCRGPENQPTEDCQKYIRCAETSKGRYEPVLQNCACNQGFDKVTKTCSTKAECIAGKPDPCKPETTENGKNKNPDNGAADLIVNNSENQNSSSNVSNGNDDSNGNVVNGNDNGNNSNSGNVANTGEETKPEVNPLIIINSGHSQNSNNVSNGDNSENGNIIDGSNNDNHA
ncbi:PREDICTED: basic-leucine zipper transcription factor A-like, partial [Polistes canadensis]|uniref:basic-leucine zipper transcription factor A-like n=1 Tax=Polistes canadensis TaxID=91411 RepID=UPI000718D8C6